MSHPDLERREQALRYAEDLKWALIPLAPTTKAPHRDLLPEDRSGKNSWKPLADRRASAAEIRSWFDRDPNCNIGVITGKASGGLVVADFDQCGIHMPLTAIAETPRGMHVYFKSDDFIRCRVFPWGDLKGEGGYVVLPPSIHPDGSRYEWYPLLSPWDTELRSYEPQLHCIDDATLGGQSVPTIKTTSNSRSVARNNMVTCYTPSLDHNATEGWRYCLSLAGDPLIALGIARMAGCDVVTIGKAFLCPLPGHDERRRHPSAALHKSDNGIIMMHCFHDGSWWPLPDLYAHAITRKARRLGSGERAAWWLRALEDFGCLSVAPLAVPLHRNAPEGARKLFEGFCRLLQLRTVYDPEQPLEAPFSWDFAARWCGIGSQSTVSKGLKWLLANGVLRIVDSAEGERHSRYTTLALGDGLALNHRDEIET